MATNNESTPARRIDDHRPAVALEWIESGAQQARAPFDRPNQWTILLTSSNHGFVGAHGHNFPHATGDFVRVNVCDEAMVAGLRERVRQLEAGSQANVRPGNPGTGVTEAEAKLYRDLTGDALALGFDCLPAALQALGAQVVSKATKSEKLTDEEIQAIWQTMPGGPAAWLKSFGYLQFAREVEEWIVANNGASVTSAAPTQPPAKDVCTQWISAEEQLPERECLAVYITPNGKQRIIRAKHAKQFQVEAQGDDCEAEYNDDDDTFYIKAGWLECIDNWGEYSSCYVTEGTVTHWMPLPAPPAAAQSVEGGAK